MNINILFALITIVFVAILLLPLLRARDISVNSRIIFSLVSSVIFLSSGYFLYQQFGTPAIIELTTQRDEKLAELKDKMLSASETLKKDPKDIKSWLQLGDSFMESNQYSGAANAYKQAVLLSQGNPAIIMAYARAIILGDNGKVSIEAKKSLDMVIMLQPESEEARYFLAVYKLQSGNMEAMQDMKALYKSLPPDSPIRAMIDRQIGRAE